MCWQVSVLCGPPPQAGDSRLLSSFSRGPSSPHTQKASSGGSYEDTTLSAKGPSSVTSFNLLPPSRPRPQTQSLWGPGLQCVKLGVDTMSFVTGRGQACLPVGVASGGPLPPALALLTLAP